ncbi:O-antigen ligase family protein [Rosenbergiella metrosideri]|uniref:O-antigen ligase family protein n=1 Tax=Rosenbergiella metrosideri TaxID=2921185 RepID=UPI001F4F2088|nr:O-antigen ligase family protein [Rosenbergiella metrosideri]
MAIFNKRLFNNISLILLMLSFFTALSDRIMGRNAFFLSVIMMLLINIKNIEFSLKKILVPLTTLIFGVALWVWYHLYCQQDNTIFLANQNYNIISRYMIFIGIALFFIQCIKPIYYGPSLRVLILTISTCSFIYVCGVGFFYFLSHPSARIRIDSAATISAYIVTLQCLFTIYIINLFSVKSKKYLISLVIALGFITLSLTETRSAILCFPIIIFIYFFNPKLFVKKKYIAYYTSIFILLSLCIKTFFPLTIERLASSYTEISEMSVNNDSSIGARVSMWQSGIYTFTKHPFGQSPSSRFQDVIHYIDSKEHGNPEGKRNSVYHLHNDLIERLSLQGVLGGISYILLLASIIYFAYKENRFREYFVLFILPIISFGSVDTLFIDKRFIIVFGAQLLLFNFFQRKNFQEK